MGGPTVIRMSPRFASLAALALLFTATNASAFCRSTTCTGNCKRNADLCKIEGAPLYWSSLCVGFSLNIDASAHITFPVFKKVVEKSIAPWSLPTCPKGDGSIAFSELKPVACHKAEYNANGANDNVILFQDNRWTYQPGGDNTLAKTTVTYDTKTGEILDADIEINHAYNEITTTDDPKLVKYDLQSILTHEFGHFLGLDHTKDSAATMNASYDPGTTDLRTLEDDDLGGVCAIYPPKRVGTCDTAPRGGSSNVCAGDAEAPSKGCAFAPERPGAWGWVAIGALAVAIGRRRRR